MPNNNFNTLNTCQEDNDCIYLMQVKEMDDEEHSFGNIQEPLYRVETGNYEYR